MWGFQIKRSPNVWVAAITPGRKRQRSLAEAEAEGEEPDRLSACVHAQAERRNRAWQGTLHARSNPLPKRRGLRDVGPLRGVGHKSEDGISENGMKAGKKNQ